MKKDLAKVKVYAEAMADSNRARDVIWLGFLQRSVLDFAGEDLIGISPLLASYGTPPRLISTMSNP